MITAPMEFKRAELLSPASLEEVLSIPGRRYLEARFGVYSILSLDVGLAVAGFANLNDASVIGRANVDEATLHNPSPEALVKLYRAQLDYESVAAQDPKAGEGKLYITLREVTIITKSGSWVSISPSGATVRELESQPSEYAQRLEQIMKAHDLIFYRNLS